MMREGPNRSRYVTYGAAREDLCQHGLMPQESVSLRVEVMQYDGVLESQWHFPLQARGALALAWLSGLRPEARAAHGL